MAYNLTDETAFFTQLAAARMPELGHIQPAREEGVEHAAQRVAIRAHLRAAAGYVPGRDRHVRQVAFAPEM